LHYTLIVRARSLGDLFGIGIFRLVSPKQPVDRAVACKPCLVDRLALALGFPLIEQAVDDRSATTFSVLAACRLVIRALWFIGDGAAELAVVLRDYKVERGFAVPEHTGHDKARPRSLQDHKSSARSRTVKFGTIARSRSSFSHSLRLPSCTRG